ncbi:hypothetical protein [Nafulsella turpanensis]|uniref:hypothetical protein n=1 Tax=Nafulsella turpanensis TaxID=1265690 RepID=UPI00034BB7D3|nr:hypothetical protein [Nafulsella turpanensis]
MKAQPLNTLLLLLFFSLAGISSLQAQDDEEEEYTREFVGGVNLNTNGGIVGLGGLTFKYSTLLRPGLYRSLTFEAVNVKHAKETRYPSFSGGTFILGKVNYLYSLRFSLGLEKIVFKRGVQQGVQVNVLASAGPSIGIISPYYVEYADGSGNYANSIPYRPGLNPSGIYGPGRPLQGIGESKISPGLHVRTGVGFEFGTFESNISGLELGLLLEAFPKRIQILSEADTQWFFPSAYLTFFFFGSRS